MKAQALLVEDDAPSLDALERLVQTHGFTTVAVQTLRQAREEIEESRPDVVILDLDLPDGNGGELIDELQSGFATEVVVVTGHGTIDSAVEAIHSGVYDYLTKPLQPERFDRILEGIKRTLALRKEVTELRENLRRLGRFGRLVGKSPAMQDVYDLLTRVAPTGSTTLLVGETGTGKDLIAETVHRMSRRSEKPYVAVNCGAIQPTLVESELFGHEPGSFTGATKIHRGVFEQAHGGTLFLDEITEMSTELQVKLLRVLETRRFARVGSDREIEVDVRVVAATNRDPHDAVRDGALREDLLYRLLVFPIPLPPLRERPGDVELLAGFLLERLNHEHDASKRFTSEALARLAAHSWPGNVRELRNAVERAFILSGDEIGVDRLPLARENGSGEPTVAPSSAAEGGSSRIPCDVGMTIAEVERRLILATLADVGERKTAAELLGISVKTLYNRLKSYEDQGLHDG